MGGSLSWVISYPESIEAHRSRFGLNSPLGENVRDAVGNPLSSFLCGSKPSARLAVAGNQHFATGAGQGDVEQRALLVLGVFARGAVGRPGERKGKRQYVSVGARDNDT